MQTWAKRNLALLREMFRGGSALNMVWSKLKWCHTAWLLYISGWLSYTAGPYFLALLWQERSSSSVFPKPASCPVEKFSSFSPRPPGEEKPHLTGFAEYFPLLLNVGDCGLATAAVWFFLVLLGSPGCVFSLRLQEQPLCIWDHFWGGGEEQETELTAMVSLRLPLRCGLSWPFLYYWPKSVTWLRQCLRGWEVCSAHGEKGEWVLANSNRIYHNSQPL